MELSTLTIVASAMALLFLLGVPIYASLIISATLGIIFKGSLPLSVIQNALFEGVNSFPLLAIPCFVIAGSLMEHGTITRRIIDVVKQMIGRVHGGLGITTVLACAFFAAISSSGPGTVAAVGALMIPAMVRHGYSKSYAAGVASSGGTIGILIPPSNPMIIYAIVGGVSVKALFTAGFIPGAVVCAAMTLTAYLVARRHGFRGFDDVPAFDARLFGKTLLKSAPALVTPVLILGSIYSGWATPVEASVVAITWALFVGGLVYRTLRVRHLYEALLTGAFVCGAVLLIVSASTLFGRLLTLEHAPDMLTAAVLSVTENKTVILLLIIGVLILLGMFMETLSTIIILVPVLMPVLGKLGIDPVHFGIILVVTNEMALLTPPLGVNVFVASNIAKIPIEKVSVAVLPYLLALSGCVLLFTFLPETVLWLPRTLGMLK